MSFNIDVYTDGSCHTQHLIGTWAAIILMDGNEITLSGTEYNTTHNRMEVLAVIKTLHYLTTTNLNIKAVNIVSDSQYLVGLINRKPKFEKANYQTKAGNAIRNYDLVVQLFDLVKIIPVSFIKIKAHQKQTATINYNIEVDKIVRHNLREAVKLI